MSRPPNIVTIICDDLAWGDLACHGNPHVRTPQLDALHHDGTRLTRYCSGPLCTAARVSLMTGRQPYRTRCIDTYLGRATMDPGEITLAEVLRDAGYATGLFGKWHLGDGYPCRPPDKGFEESLWHRGGGLRQPGNVGRDSYFDPDLWRGTELVRTQGYCTDIFCEAALEFIGQPRDRPFFCYLATNAPHSPFEIGDAWVEPYRAAGLPEKLARIYGMVENIDHAVGRVLQRLDELGLASNTIVLFTSDHGPCPSAHIDGRPRWNAGLRGFKSEMYEGGLRVPALLRWPGRLPAGRDVDRVAAPLDWLPTFAAAAGAKLPTDRALDGIDLLPLLSGAVHEEAWPDRAIAYQWHRGDVPVRYRNAALVSQRYKWYRRHETLPDELFDLLADPLEQQDLAAAEPAVVAELRDEYEAWFDDVSATRGHNPAENYAPPPLHLGQPTENPAVLTRQDWRLYDPAHEGWGDEFPGFWPVIVARAGRYRLQVDLPPVGAAWTLHVQCGDYAASRPTLPGAEAEVFDDVALAAGPTELHAYLDSEAGRRGVRFVWVTRHEE